MNVDYPTIGVVLGAFAWLLKVMRDYRSEQKTIAQDAADQVLLTLDQRKGDALPQPLEIRLQQEFVTRTEFNRLVDSLRQDTHESSVSMRTQISNLHKRITQVGEQVTGLAAEMKHMSADVRELRSELHDTMRTATAALTEAQARQ
jgi:methyl-accepting chemotaxis protein